MPTSSFICTTKEDIHFLHLRTISVSCYALCDNVYFSYYVPQCECVGGVVLFARTCTLVKSSQELSIEFYETVIIIMTTRLTKYNCRLFRLNGTCMASQAKSKSMILQYYHMHVSQICIQYRLMAKFTKSDTHSCTLKKNIDEVTYSADHVTSGQSDLM